MTDPPLSPQVFIDAVNTDCNSGFSLPFNKRHKRRWMSSHGVSPELCSIIWTRLDPETTIPGGEYKHLMWALYFLRVYGTEEQNRRASGGADEKTFRKWTLLFVEAISFLESSVVSGMSCKHFSWKSNTQYICLKFSSPQLFPNVMR